MSSSSSACPTRPQTERQHLRMRARQQLPSTVQAVSSKATAARMRAYAFNSSASMQAHQLIQHQQATKQQNC
jgi:hypothetical protein